MRLMMGKVFLNNKLKTGIVLTSIVVLRTAIMVNKHSKFHLDRTRTDDAGIV
jgi:hypothetical protein